MGGVSIRIKIAGICLASLFAFIFLIFWFGSMLGDPLPGARKPSALAWTFLIATTLSIWWVIVLLISLLAPFHTEQGAIGSSSAQMDLLIAGGCLCGVAALAYIFWPAPNLWSPGFNIAALFIGIVLGPPMVAVGVRRRILRKRAPN